MIADRLALYDLFAAYGALIDAGAWNAWLDLFAAVCRYQIIPRENADLGMPAGLIFCDSRAVLEDRIMALREANKYNREIRKRTTCENIEESANVSTAQNVCEHIF